MYKYCLIRAKTLLFLGVILLFTTSSAMAQMRFGLRAGGTINPEQFHFGVHAITQPLFENFTFRPNLEVGVSSFALVSANFEFAYAFPIEKHPFSLYAGVGPALLIHTKNDVDAGGGINFLFGLDHDNGFMGEIKIGVIDSPDVKFTVGYTF